MARTFDVPAYYRSSLVTTLKIGRRTNDPRKKDWSPTIYETPDVRFKLARHFGFCYGVENAIEIAYRAVRENPGKRVFLLSEMIHNRHVNDDLRKHGVQFLQSARGEELVPLATLNQDDIVIIPAFGTTREMFAELENRGVEPKAYNATCPFVEKVWKRANELGQDGYTVVVHGKPDHEETRATFSHALASSPSLVIQDRQEAHTLAHFIDGSRPLHAFGEVFAHRTSPGFRPEEHLLRIGVVNQTTMLASETQEIVNILREAVRRRFGEGALSEHFADTRDTLCYATEENQQSVYALLNESAHFALVVGGYNSSNTSHLAELCEAKLPTYYICDADEILSANEIRFYDQHAKTVRVATNWLPVTPRPIEVLLTAGASCPDAIIDQVIARVSELAAQRREPVPGAGCTNFT